MAILRKNKKDKYTVIDNAVFFDYRLSFKAKGLLCQMLSLPDGWSFSVEGLSQFSCDGITVVRNALTELENRNYLKRTQLRDGEGKMAGVEYVVSETPMLDEPISENPISDNITLLNTKELNTNKSNTKRFKVPSIEEVQEYIDENDYSVDAERFIDYYTSNGWMVGKNHMKDWKATVRNWERKNGTNTGSGNTVRSRVSDCGGGTYGGSFESGEGVRTKLPPMAALSNEAE